MIQRTSQNIGHSAFQRLLNYARSHGEDFNFLLFRYGIERFLYRLSVSPYADKFVLKGASLFLAWKGQNYRVTKDVDLLGSGPADSEHIIMVFKELCRSTIDPVESLEFIPDSIQVVPIREGQAYEGIRVTLQATLFNARIPLQVDIGFGDAITPEPTRIEYPTLLDDPPPKILAYPRYTMVAEKTEAMVHLGMVTSRMKDFYDIWLMSQIFEFDGAILCNALRNTFERRSTLLPGSLPIAFSNEFRIDTQKQTQWQAFLRKSKPDDAPKDFQVVIEKIAAFLKPVLFVAQIEKPFKSFWPPGGPWQNPTG